jgi:hypothetical protein
MAGKPGGSGGQGGHEGSEMLYLAMVIVVCIVGWALWAYARNVVVWFFFCFKWLELKTLGILHGGLGVKGTQLLKFIEACFDGRIDPFSVKWEEVEAVNTMVGSQTSFAFGIIIGLMAATCAMKMKGNGFTRKFSLSGTKIDDQFYFAGIKITHSKAEKWIKFFFQGGQGKWWITRQISSLLATILMCKKLCVTKTERVDAGPSLAHYQMEFWKVITPGVLFNPEADDPNQEPARTPLEWMRDNGISLTERDGLDTEAARTTFERQLGDTWSGLDKAPTYVRAVAVLCALNAKRDRDCRKAKENISVAYATIRDRKKADQVVEGIIAKYLKDQKIVKAISKYANKHAYTNTAMYALLEWGRKQGGVFAAAEIRWVKAIDRTLWYALNNCGRRAFHIEGAGAVSHFFTERVAGGPMVEPYVDQAIDGLEDYIDHQGLMDLEAFFRVERDF